MLRAPARNRVAAAGIGRKYPHGPCERRMQVALLHFNACMDSCGEAGTMKTFRLVVALLLLAGSPGVRAHSMLHASVPADGARVSVAPAALELSFGSDVRLIALRMSGADGVAVEVPSPSSRDAAREFRLPLPALAPQHYTVDWTVMGADTHRVSGSFAFDIGDPPR